MQKCHTRRRILATGIIATSALGLLVDCGGSGNNAANGDPPPAADGGRPLAEAGTTQSKHQPVPCDSQSQCTGGSTVTCCSGFCVDTSADPANCGQCGVACSSAQFCDGTGCKDTVIANVCANPRGTVVLDSYDVDNAAGTAMGKALSSYCTPAPKIAQLAQSSAGVLDPGSGRPTTGVGNTFIAGGGAFGQQGIAYIELMSPVSPLYLHNDGTTTEIRNRAAGTNVVETMDTGLTAHHDFFYVQLAVEPDSGTLCFSAVGILGPGTQAAGYYASAVIVPNLSTYTKGWYVFEWTDTNNDSTADSGDTFTMVGSGP